MNKPTKAEMQKFLENIAFSPEARSVGDLTLVKSLAVLYSSGVVSLNTESEAYAVVEEIVSGIWPAYQEWLEENPELA